MKLTFAIDLAESIFHVAVSRHPGKVAENHRLSRARLLRYFAEQRPATVLLEACSSSHFWARQLQELGHKVILLPPRDVRPPREHSSGHSRRLGRITKRGDNYLRALVIHGARSLLVAAKKKRKSDPLCAWARKLLESRGFNTAVVALANKLARIVWCVWTQERGFYELPRAA